MRFFLTLLWIVASCTAFSQTVIVAETFPSNKFNSTGLGGQSGSYTGDLSSWNFKSSTSAIIEVDNAPGTGYTQALRFATGGNGGNNNPRVDTATSPNVNLASGACSVTSLNFNFDWYVDAGSNNDYDVTLEFSGNGGGTWNTAWTNTALPGNDAWRTVTVSIPNNNSYWSGADFRFRFTSRRSAGSNVSDIWFDNIQILATSSGADVPAFSAAPVLVQGTDLQPGAVYLYSNVLTAPTPMDALIKIEADSNAHVTYLDNNVPNSGRFQPRIANDGQLGDGAETSDRGWVQFSITYIQQGSYAENNPSTDLDDIYITRTLAGLRYQHYDVDGFANGTSGYFRETGWIANPLSVLVNTPTALADGGTVLAGGYLWRKILGEIGEHSGLSSDPNVVFTSTYGLVSVVRFRFGFEFVKGNGPTVASQEREYATEFTCLSFASAASLPVRLLSFNGSYNNKATTLNWETENEQNFDHFEIERSSNSTNYTPIGTKASANSQARTSYQFIDDLSMVSGNVFYYRLKIMDKDGQFKYSSVIMIRKESKTINGVALNPNPVVNGMATVRFTSASTQAVNFRIIDMAGKVLLQQQNKVYEGNNSISLNNLEHLQPGIYLLQLANGDELMTIKFNVAR
jgi:hypothetical protein